MNSDNLSQLVIDEYNNLIKTNAQIRSLMFKIKRGEANYIEAYKLSRLTGKALQQAISKQINNDILVDKQLTIEIANELVNKSLQLNAQNISNVCENIQKTLNKKNNINLTPYTNVYDYEKTQGIIKYVSSKKYKDIEKSFMQSLVTNSQSVVDDAVRGNAKIHSKCGFSPKIVRIGHHGMCKWCSNLVGTYNYEDVNNTGNDVFRRHANCECMVLYNPGDGVKEMQNVHTKYLLDKYERIAIEKRIERVNLKTSNMTPDEYWQYKTELKYYKNKFKQIKLPSDEYYHVLSEVNTNLTTYDKKQAIIIKPIGNFIYTILNDEEGFVIVGKEIIL